MTSVKDFTKRVFGTSKIMTAVAVAMIVVSVVMGGLFVAGWASKEQKENMAEEQMTTGRSTTPSGQNSGSSTPQRTYTAAEVSQHNSLQDCWMIIDTSVYDVTEFLGQHPGGAQAMLKYCGEDGTRGFGTMDRGQSHSSSASQLKEDYKIGTLAN